MSTGFLNARMESQSSFNQHGMCTLSDFTRSINSSTNFDRYSMHAILECHRDSLQVRMRTTTCMQYAGFIKRKTLNISNKAWSAPSDTTPRKNAKESLFKISTHLPKSLLTFRILQYMPQHTCTWDMDMDMVWVGVHVYRTHEVQVHDMLKP